VSVGKRQNPAVIQRIAWRSNSQLEANDELRSEHVRVATVFQTAVEQNFCYALNLSAHWLRHPKELLTRGLQLTNLLGRHAH